MWVDDAMKEVAAAHVFPAHTHIFLMCEAELARRMNAVTTAFAEAVPSSTGAEPSVRFLHAFAVKANPLRAVLQVAERCGFGAETASIGEFMMSERVFGDSSNSSSSTHSAHHSGPRIVFDSPAKTYEELHYALQRPCYLNADNFEELERMSELVDGAIPGLAKIDSVKAIVGVRVNPQTVEATSNTALATGGKISKFGVSLHDKGNLEKLIESFVRWHDKLHLRMVHVHSGSQGLSLDTMVTGVRAVMQELVDCPRVAHLIDVVDIGGGFPVDFSTDAETVTMRTYVQALAAAVPTLFCPAPSRAAETAPRTIITEFGRAIAAKSGVLISRVEYAKMSGGRQIILQHAGADLAVRTVWQPEKWPLRVYLYSATGENRCAPAITAAAAAAHASAPAAAAAAALPEGFVLTDVAGPCCNSGCALIRGTPMPADVKPLSDLIVAHDVGGYYHSSFCLYNLRQMPACFMLVDRAEVHDGRESLICLRPPQSVEDTIQLFL